MQEEVILWLEVLDDVNSINCAIFIAIKHNFRRNKIHPDVINDEV